MVHSQGIKGANIYCASNDGHIYCYNKINGSLIWVTKVDSVRSIEITIEDSIIIVSSLKPMVFILNAMNGKITDSFKINNTHANAITTYFGSVILGCNDSNIYSYSLSKKSIVWKTKVSGYYSNTIMILDKLIIAGAGNKFYIIDPTDGIITKELAVVTFEPLFDWALRDSIIFVNNSDRITAFRLSQLDKSNRSKAYLIPEDYVMSEFLYPYIAICDSGLAISHYNKGIYGISFSKGHGVEWHYDKKEPIRKCSFFKDSLFFCSDDKTFGCLNPKDGKEIFTVKTPCEIVNFNYQDGKLYGTCVDHKLYAFKIR